MEVFPWTSPSQVTKVRTVPPAPQTTALSHCLPEVSQSQLPSWGSLPGSYLKTGLLWSHLLASCSLGISQSRAQVLPPVLSWALRCPHSGPPGEACRDQTLPWVLPEDAPTSPVQSAPCCCHAWAEATHGPAPTGGDRSAPIQPGAPSTLASQA